jgi:hypothetical protein
MGDGERLLAVPFANGETARCRIKRKNAKEQLMVSSPHRPSGKRTLTSGQRHKLVAALTLTALVAALFGFEPGNLWSAATDTGGSTAHAMTSGTPGPQPCAPGAAQRGFADAASGVSGSSPPTYAQPTLDPAQLVESPAILTGAIYSDTGTPLPGRAVELTHQYTRKKYTTTADAQGHYSISVIESAGNYRLFVVGGAGHKDYQQYLEIAGAAAELNVFLESYETGEIAGQLVNRGGVPAPDFGPVRGNTGS